MKGTIVEVIIARDVLFVSRSYKQALLKTKLCFCYFSSQNQLNTKYCPFIVSPKVDKPAEDSELEPNNQSAVVSIVMLSPMGKREWLKHTNMAVYKVLCHEYTLI